MNKSELINLILEAFNLDLESTVNPGPTFKDLEILNTGQLWAIALDMELLENELE
jgi:hypothetical protein